MTQVLISQETQEKIKQLLQQKAKTPRPLAAADALKKIRSFVSRMLKKGHSFEDVRTALAEQNLNLSFEVIKAFYTLPKGGEKSKRKSRKHSNEKIPALAQPISQEQLEAIVAAFQQLAQTRKGRTLQELVSTLEQEIDEDLNAGWDYDDIVQWLEDDFNVKIAASTLKRYHKDTKRKKEQTLQKQTEQEDKEATTATPPKRLQEPSSALKTTLAGEFNL